MKTEKHEIARAVDRFATVMQVKMFKKYDAGFRGWDNPELETLILNKLKDNLARKDYVDVGNCAMILRRFQEEKTKAKPKPDLRGGG